MKQLLEYLASVGEGTIADTAKLEALLMNCWDEFSGSRDEGMTAYKLSGRLEDVRWSPPVLSFVIERHGATTLGSTRAEVQEWVLDTDTVSAYCYNMGYRQVVPRQPPFKAGPVAEEIAHMIIRREEDERLEWNADGTVRVLIGEILPEYSAVKETLTARRKRLRKKLDELMADAGWRTVKYWTYVPPAE